MLEMPYLYQIKIGTGWDLDFKSTFGDNTYAWWKDVATGTTYGPTHYSDMPVSANKTYVRTVGTPVFKEAPATEETPAVQNTPTVEEVPPVAEEVPAPVVEEPVTQE